MSSALAEVAQLKPEIRLAQAVSEFEAALSDEQKAAFRTCKSQARVSPPDAGDIMRLTAELDRRASGSGHRGRCFGPRFFNILETIQQFASLGDIVVGGGQNIIACGVWSLVRMTLLLVVNFHSYFEKLSALLMAIGRSSPRYQMMALLYPQSKRLQSDLCEYFIVIVRLCHQHLKLTQKSKLGQLASFLSDSELKTYQSSTDLWASSIKEEVHALMARDISEQSSQTKILLKFSKSETHRKKFKAYFRLLDACSTYDYQKAWKETRKAGYSTLLDRADEYRDWKVQTSSCTLVCTGILGSGKSVLLANMVDDLNLHVQKEPLPIAYFFCRHDDSDSLQARTIMGCLARQLLGPPPGPAGLESVVDAIIPTMDVDGVTSLLLKTLPPRAYAIVDGLDECSDYERRTLMYALGQLQNKSSLLVCISFRTEADTTLRLRTGDFVRPGVLQIPDDNPDIEQFINVELESCIVSGELKMGDPRLVLDIQDALMRGAHGMFLWVALQVQSLCTAKTDEAIRKALADLPKDLPATFSRILQKAETLGKDYQQKTLKLVIAARRPLTTDELREALSVNPGNTDWKPAQLLNEIYSALACCGSLVTVDEEDFTVRLVHHSVKQFLLGGTGDPSGGMFTYDSAMETMGHIVVTYLNYGVFDNQLSTLVAPQIMAATASRKIIESTLGASSSSGRVQELALRLLKSRKQSHCNIGPLLMDEARPPGPLDTNQFFFLPYAKLHCLHHVRYTAVKEPGVYDLVFELLRRGMIDASVKHAGGLTLFQWAIKHGREADVRLLLEKGAGTKVKTVTMEEPLHLAANSGCEGITQLLLDAGINMDATNVHRQTPLHYAAQQGHVAVLRLLLDRGANKEVEDWQGRRPLHFSAEGGHETAMQLLFEEGADKEAQDRKGRRPLHYSAQGGHEAVTQLLFEKGADKEAPDRNGRRPLHYSVQGGHEAVTQLLFEKGADKEAEESTQLRPLHLAAWYGKEAVARLLLDQGVDKEAGDGNGWRPLHWAARYGSDSVARLLLDRGANIEAGDRNGCGPLHVAARYGRETAARLLLETGADKEAEDRNGWRPLHLAARYGNEAAARLLLETGADKEAEDRGGRRPLHDAARHGNEAIARLLLSWGADIEATNGLGWTPLHYSVYFKRKAVTQLLLQRGADKDAKNMNGNSPWDFAARTPYMEALFLSVP
ncbi:hypothetical protein MAPG_01765 [Magnaporthiopsis poae ATCC 64411]|uniref:Uncharacterized protein n=1 Tax=Magnaporthiopsis poae (strain ATCC 64411 / 73-15) TaxID=644358 RepID=A0A0C4DPJ7_MAGP6|nr:hypothetical protein MAPG_01765 [Magnaporthiopsis poae ATCC 64411]